MGREPPRARGSTPPGGGSTTPATTVTALPDLSALRWAAMSRKRAPRPTSRRSWLAAVTQGGLLGMLWKAEAEAAYALYRLQAVQEVAWLGSTLQARLSRPDCTVAVADCGEGETPTFSCSLCPANAQPCRHVAAALFRWIEIRTTMRRKGPGTMWRRWSRQPFLSLETDQTERQDLSHLEPGVLLSSLAFQLSLSRDHGSTARLVGDEVEIRLTLPSGEERIVAFHASLLPPILPALRTVPGLSLGGELKELELSELRFRPALRGDWREDGIHLDPGYLLPGGEFVPLEKVEDRMWGGWVRVGHRLCRLLDPPTSLVPYFESGSRVLRGKEALSFLTLDHPTLSQQPWYLPRGILARFTRPVTPDLAEIVLSEDSRGRVRLTAEWRVGEARIPWAEVLKLRTQGFIRVGEAIVRAPDLGIFEAAGFRLPRRGAGRGMTGDRLAALRIAADAQVPVRSPAPSLAALLDALLAPLPSDPPEPPGLNSRLRPYQRTGVAWLLRLQRLGLGGLLADDMGLGKTHQAMGLLCTLHGENPDLRALVICPRGVLGHWENLLRTYAPVLPVHVFHGTQRNSVSASESAGVLLTTYETALRSIQPLSAAPWNVVIFDEAQKVKNPRTKAARAMRSIDAAFKLALTGTPVENRLLELWSVVDLVLPGYLGSERAFRLAHRAPSAGQLELLRRRVGLITLRRVKEQVLDDLPGKMETVLPCELTPRQAELYAAIAAEQLPPIRESLHAAGDAIPYMHIFALLTRLKQVCDHPALLTGGSPSPEHSGKLQVLDELLDEPLASNQQVVVFSHFVEMLKLLMRHLERRGVPSLLLTGQTRDRERVVRRFNSSQHEPVLLASLLAGGVGIDLTAASVVIHYDRWWNPAKENQATDRVHRIGQRRFVQVYKLLTRNTIEERIDRLIRDKSELAEQVVASSESILRALTRAELAELLGIPPGSPPPREEPTP